MSLLFTRLFCCACVVMHAQILFVPCVYAQIMCLECARVVPEVLHSFFPNLHRLFETHRAPHWPKPHVQEHSKTEIHTLVLKSVDNWNRHLYVRTIIRTRSQ